MHAAHKPRQSVSEQQQNQGPVEDTGSAKKSVRFADEVESEDIAASNNTNASSQPEPDRPHNTLLSAQGVGREEKGESGNEVLEASKELMQAKEPLHGGEGDLSRVVKLDESETRLEHPVFPWQQKKRDRGLVDSHNIANPLHTKGLTLDSKHSLPALEPQPRKGAEERRNIHTSTGNDALPVRTQPLPEKQREEQRKQPKEVGIKVQENFESESENERTQNEVRAHTTIACSQTLHIYLHPYDLGTSEVIGASPGGFRRESERCGGREERTADRFAEQRARTYFSTQGNEGKGIYMHAALYFFTVDLAGE